MYNFQKNNKFLVPYNIIASLLCKPSRFCNEESIYTDCTKKISDNRVIIRDFLP